MNQSNIARRVLLTGLFALISATISLVMLFGMFAFPFFSPFKHQIKSPILAVELATDDSELCAVIGTTQPASATQESCSNPQKQANPHNAAKAIALIIADTWEDLLFIPVYALFIYSFAALEVAVSDGKGKLLSQMVGVSILLAAIFDYLEDLGIFTSLKADTLDLSVISHTRAVSLAKWSLIGVSLMLVGIILLRAGDSLYGSVLRNILSWLAIAAGIMMLVSTLLPGLMLYANSLFALLILLNAVFCTSRGGAEYWLRRVNP